MDQLPEGFVLDDDNNAQSEGLPPGFVLDADDPMESQGVLEKSRKALQYGAAQRLVGLGKTGKSILGKGDFLESVGKMIAPDDYRPASSDFFDPKDGEKGPAGFGWGYLPRMLLESAPGLATDLGVGAVTGPAGFMASNAAANFGPALEARVSNNGPDATPTPTDYAVAAGSTALQAYLNRVGVNPALNSVVKGAGAKAIAQIPGQIAKSGAVDAATGAAGNLIDQVAVTAGTNNGLEIDPRQVIGSGAASGATGAALRSTRVPGDVINSVKALEFDPESATRVSGYMKELGRDVTSGKDAFTAINSTEARINAITSNAKKEANTFIRETGAGELVDTARALVKRGEVLTDDLLSSLDTALGSRPDGVALINAIRDHSTLNGLKQRGAMDTGSQTFESGISGKLAPLLDPRRTAGKFLATGTAATATASQLASQLGLSAGPLAKLMALQSGAYASTKAIDKVFGQSAPVREFTDRFNGFAETPTPEGLSTKQLAAQAKSTSLAERNATKQAMRDEKAAVASEREANRLAKQAQTRRAAEEKMQARIATREEAMRLKAEAGEASLYSQESPDTQFHQKPTNEAPKASALDGDDYVVRVGSVEVRAPKGDVRKPQAWASKVRQRLETRKSFVDALRSETGSSGKEAAEALEMRLSNGSKSWEDAYYHVEDFIDSIKNNEPLQSKLWDTYNAWEGKIKGTYNDKAPR